MTQYGTYANGINNVNGINSSSVVTYTNAISTTDDGISHKNYGINGVDTKKTTFKSTLSSSSSASPTSSDHLMTQISLNDAKEILSEHLKNQEKQLFSSFKTVELWKDYFEKYKRKTESEIKVRDEEIRRSHQTIENLKKVISQKAQM